MTPVPCSASWTLSTSSNRESDPRDVAPDGSGRATPTAAQLVKELSSRAGEVDLIASDVIWTAEFAKNRWVEDLSRRFYDAYDRDSFLAPALGSATYRLRIWGVPWYTDAGLLFYRKDKLAKSGFAAPPATWERARSRRSRKVMQDTGTRYGFVFQGAEYEGEGGGRHAAEYIWSAGGEYDHRPAHGHRGSHAWGDRDGFGAGWQ